MKKIRKILILVLLFTTVFMMFSCGNKQKEYKLGPEGTIVFDDGDVIGSGSTEFTLEVVDKQGAKTTAKILTDEEYVGKALFNLSIIGGEDSSFGLYIKVVNGIVADYDIDQTYWAFYIDGEYALQGADTTEIKDKSTYTFRVEK